jgi:hypothetical protein
MADRCDYSTDEPLMAPPIPFAVPRPRSAEERRWLSDFISLRNNEGCGFRPTPSASVGRCRDGGSF